MYDTVAGLGFEAARQLGLKDTTKKVILACRNLEKANKAKQQLEELTGNKNIYNVLILDVGNLDSCRNAAKELEGTVDGIILVSFVVVSLDGVCVHIVSYCLSLFFVHKI